MSTYIGAFCVSFIDQWYCVYCVIVKLPTFFYFWIKNFVKLKFGVYFEINKTNFRVFDELYRYLKNSWNSTKVLKQCFYVIHSKLLPWICKQFDVSWGHTVFPLWLNIHFFSLQTVNFRFDKCKQFPTLLLN